VPKLSAIRRLEAKRMDESPLTRTAEFATMRLWSRRHFPLRHFSGGNEADMIISKSKTKETVKQCNVSGDFYDALDKKVKDLIKDAEKRAVANSRKTVRPCDL
jgi:hypothetical protein